jgi:hypothetical protein
VDGIDAARRANEERSERWWLELDGKLPVRARQTATGTIVVEVPAAGGVADGVVPTDDATPSSC